MTGNVCLEMPELSHLAAEPLTCSQRARAVIDREKLDLEIELAARRFAPSESIFDSGQREDARKPVFAFFDALWVALARDEPSKPGAAKLDREEVTRRVWQIFLEEGWLASYMKAETQKFFDHLVESSPQGTNAHWRVFALDSFFSIDERLPELEKCARDEVVQTIRAEESAATEVQPAGPTKSTGGEPPSTEEGVEETQNRNRRRGRGALTDERPLKLYYEMGRLRREDGLAGKEIVKALDRPSSGFTVNDLPKGRTWSGQATTFLKLYDHGDSDIQNAFHKFVSDTSTKYAEQEAA